MYELRHNEDWNDSHPSTYLCVFLMEEYYHWLRSNAYMRILSYNTFVL